MKQFHFLLPAAAVWLFLSSCNSGDHPDRLFRKIAASDHGIDFQNTISENDTLNILTLEYIYNGGGVAIGDFNNDGLSDVFFTGNMVANKLYLNKGNFEFQDVSEKAGIGIPEKWKSGVAVADVNADGWLDIYVCATIHGKARLRENALFIHQGLDADGTPIFKDEAAAYGVNSSSHSSGAAFLDYDNDGDLDLYVLTNSIVRGIPTTYREKINDGTVNADILYRNNGDGTFTDVSNAAGIVHEGYGLGLGIADINLDGWQDIYVSNDYITNDLMYINNGDGTFTNAIGRHIRHQSQFSMGNDISDFNNDGFPDIITLDMLPEGNLRRKTVIVGANYSSYIYNERYNYEHQYVRNVLQLNNGNGTFSEIGQFAGVHQTEWSWSPLFMDVDNDGFRDLFVTNGFPKDVTDKDFANFRAETGSVASVAYQMDSIPVVKIANYAYRNNGDLTFTDVTKKWGMDDPSFSNGASFADFDNDGDLDYLINNINGEVLLYENTLYGKGKQTSRHFLRLKLEGDGKNRSGFGTKVLLKYGNGATQYHDHSVARGYISSVEDVIHFGLDSIDTIDSLIVRWPDGRSNVLTSVKADQVLTVRQRDASGDAKRKFSRPQASLLAEKGDLLKESFIPAENDKIDFNLQRTIPHKFSQSGPGVAVGDVNGDGLEDFYVGGAAGYNGSLFLQQKGGAFSRRELVKSPSGQEEDQGAIFFDADNDNDLDLYVVSGTFEFELNSPKHQDRLYLNDGRGNFALRADALPSTTSSGSCVRAADFDADGDLDLFVGGRVIPGQYPFAPESYLLINEGGQFVNHTQEIGKGLDNVGMVTDAIWTDFDNDGKTDLLVAREFMPIALFAQRNGKLEQVNGSGLEKYSGWWNSLAAADFDKDGDIDFVAGNLGQNNYYKASDQTPLRVYAKDYDQNNSVDAVLTCYLKAEDGTMKEFPVHFWEELNSQSPIFRRKFRYFKKYGRSTIDQVLTEAERKDALILTANYMSTSYIENAGNGKFKVTPLPVRAQFAPVNGIAVADVNGDGNRDVLLVGNDYGNEVFTGRHDAFTGLVLLGNGKGSFNALDPNEGGLQVCGDAKGLATIPTDRGDVFVAAQNRDTLKLFSSAPASSFVYRPLTDDAYGVAYYEDGTKEKVEFYYGAGYLSQSSRSVRFTRPLKNLVIYNSKGEERTGTLLTAK